MATNRKYLNISIQPVKVPRASKTLFELPRDNLTETELVAKSTSDRTKRRVAHEEWFPLPVITKPIVPVKEVAQPKPKKKHALKKCFSSIKPCKVRQFNETLALDSRAQHSKSSTSGVDDGVKAEKRRKSGDLECGEMKTIKKNKGNVEKTKKEDLKHGKKPCPLKGVDEDVKAEKRKLGDLGCSEVKIIKKNKGNVEKAKNKEVEHRKKPHPLKDLA